jgi:hypothetical protein
VSKTLKESKVPAIAVGLVVLATLLANWNWILAMPQEMRIERHLFVGELLTTYEEGSSVCLVTKPQTDTGHGTIVYFAREKNIRLKDENCEEGDIIIGVPEREADFLKWLPPGASHKTYYNNFEEPWVLEYVPESTS